MRQATITLAVTAALLTGCTASASARSRPELRVLAAASLRPVFERVTPYLEEATDSRLIFEFAASGILRTQIAAGAPADVFASAAPEHVSALVDAGLVERGAVTFAGNDTVLFVAQDGSAGIRDVADLMRVDRFAMGDPTAAPHGVQARAWLKERGLWDALRGRAVYGQNAAQTVDYVARGEVGAGIGFASDAMRLPGVRIVSVAPRDGVPLARYVAGVVSDTREPELARRFVACLRSPQVRSALAESGLVLREDAE